MAAEHILVVDDEEDILELVSYNLTRAGYRVTGVTSGEEAIKSARSKLPDLVLLDLMLPGVDGLEVCNTLKRDQRTANIPVVMLTARGEEADIVSGLELGADDYITKPFSPRVLLARIKAVLRRKTKAPVEEQAVIKLGPGRRYEYDLDKCTGCAICYDQCPCGAITMIPEPPATIATDA